MFGAGEAATHSLSLLFGLLTHPGGHCGPAGACSAAAPGMYAAVLFAFSTFLTAYAQETRMYELMGLLGILADGGIHPRLRLPATALPDRVRGLRRR